MEPEERYLWNRLDMPWANDHLEYMSEWHPEFLMELFKEDKLADYLERRVQAATDLLARLEKAGVEHPDREEQIYSAIINPEISEELSEHPPKELPSEDWERIKRWLAEECDKWETEAVEYRKNNPDE